MKHRKDYSVGVFYLALLNFLRAERFKWENIIVLGIVPSLDREPKDLNQFLEPTIDELKALWKGGSFEVMCFQIPIDILCSSYKHLA